MEKELEKLEQNPPVDLHLDSQREPFQKIPNWKTPSYDGIHGFSLKKIHNHPRQIGFAAEKMPGRKRIPDWTTKGELTLSRRTPQKKRLS